MPNIATKTESVPSNSKLAADTNKTGSWSAQSPSETTATDVTFYGDIPLHASTAIFSYRGGTVGSPPVLVPPVMSTVTLTPGTTAFTVGGQSVLLDGDTQQDMHGNEVRVCQSASGASSD